MSGSFLDTTVVINLADEATDGHAQSRRHVIENQPVSTPYYALRELLAGHLRVICEAHNRLLGAQNAGEALVSMLRGTPAEGRKKEGRMLVVAQALTETFSAAAADRESMKREMLQAIALKANNLWRKARKPSSGYALTQPLACFNEGKLSYGAAGELRPPADSFNCHKAARCAAASYLFDRESELSKLIDALHPATLGNAAAKNENQQRRKALKELKQHGPKNFSKARCRAIGDAYFAAMCPPGAEVVTTNIADHGFLCEALGKTAVVP